MQKEQTGRVVILLKISRTADGHQTYEVLQGEELKIFLEHQKIARALFEDYRFFNEKEDTRDKNWQPIVPIKIKLKENKFLFLGKSKKNQTHDKTKKIIQLIRVIEYSDKSIAYQTISGQKLRKFLEKMSWVELVVQNYQLAHQNIHWLEIEPLKIKLLKTGDL